MAGPQHSRGYIEILVPHPALALGVSCTPPTANPAHEEWTGGNHWGVAQWPTRTSWDLTWEGSDLTASFAAYSLPSIYTFLLGRFVVLEMPASPKCHAGEKTWLLTMWIFVCPEQCWYCPCRSILPTPMPQMLWRICKYFPKSNTAFFYANILSYTKCYSLPGRYSVLPEPSDAQARHWELPNCLSHTPILNVCNFCHPETSVLFLTAYLHKMHFTSVFSNPPSWALFTFSVYKSVYFSLEIEVAQDKWKLWYMVADRCLDNLMNALAGICTLHTFCMAGSFELGG